MEEYITLQREVQAIRIPSGNQVTLSAGAHVMITQALGGSYTVLVENEPGIYRISGADADALGKERLDAQQSEGEFNEEQVWTQLRNCYDPEIPVNIVDLGLVYALNISEANGGRHVDVQMTLTAPGCGMGPALAADAQERVLAVPGVTSANVQVVWDPPWTPDRISQAGRERLGMA